MSASQDKNQKFTFVYSNIYKMGKRPVEAPTEKKSDKREEVSSFYPVDQTQAKCGSGVVLKAQDLRSPDLQSKAVVSPFVPAELLRKRSDRSEEVLSGRPAHSRGIAPRVSKNETIESLKQNLKSLNELHTRLRFMLQELEELVKD